MESVTSSQTAIFWLTAVGIILTGILIWIGMVTYRSSIPRRKLLITIISRSQIMSVPESIRNDLQIRFKNEQIEDDLFVTAIELSNSGKTAIKSTDFDGSRSLRMAIDKQIVKLLSTEHTPMSAPTPTITATDSTFSLEPELIAKGEVIKLALLTKGRPSQVKTEFSPLGDIPTQFNDREQQIRKRSRLTGTAAAVLTVLLVLGTAADFYGLIRALNEARGTASSVETLITDVECNDLKQDLQGTNISIYTLETEAPDAPEKLTKFNAITETSIYTLISLTSNLINLIQDYEDLAPLNASADKASSLGNDAFQLTEGAIKSGLGKPEMMKLSDQLTSIDKTFSSASAISAECPK